MALSIWPKDQTAKHAGGGKKKEKTLLSLRPNSFYDIINAQYWVRINYRSILQNHIFTNNEQKYITLLPFDRGMFAV
jgi:hypothetical protein